MHSLVLGGSTFVGRRLVQQLVNDGTNVTVLNRGRTETSLPPGVDRLIADRTDMASMRAALNGKDWDAVIDVSGFVMVAGGSPIGELLELLDGSTGAYVFVSSMTAYAPSQVMPWTEDQPVSTAPTSTYGGFKAYAESQILSRHRSTGFPGAIARPAAIYGPDNNIHDMETAMFLRLRRKKPVLVPHGGLVTVSYGHVDDLCALLVAMSVNPAGVRGQVINATGQAITAAGYVQTLADIVGVEADVRMISDDLVAKTPGPLFGHLFGVRHHGILSTEKARRDLGLPAERGFVEGHRQTYEWFESSPLIDAPDVLSDPMWGAGYDFTAEAQAAAALTQ
jgi:nucleoside-diphosphate-sugar epimerase